MLTLERLLERRTGVLAKLAAFAFLSIAAVDAQAQSLVNFGDTITSPGVYILNGNQSGVGDGITIDSDDVTLLLLRFTLRGEACDIGVKIHDHDNVTVYGGRITNFCSSIEIINADYCTVKDVRLDHCVESGIHARNVANSWFLRLRADHNGEWGVKAESCHDSRFLSIQSSYNRRDGILIGFHSAFGGSESNKVRLCWSAYNDGAGIRVRDSDDNDVIQNQCVNNGGAGIHLDGALELTSLGGPDGSDDNFLRSNWCVFNARGIVVETRSTDNELTNNTALANSSTDMVDENPEPPCANTWFLNFFFLKDGDGEDCIF